MLKLSLLLVVVISLWLVESSLAQTTTQARLCDPGKYKASSGCVLCAAGYFCTGYTTSQTICPIGTMSSTTGQSACTPCMPGSYALTAGSKACTVAAAGYYAPNATKVIACPVGSSTNNQTGQTQCTPCEPGSVATVAGSKFCSWCAEGFYCPNATSSILCPKGKASRYNSSDYFRDYKRCKLCPIGTTASVAGSKVCSPCKNGSYCPNPFLPPILCPRGKSSLLVPDSQYYYGYEYYFSAYYDWASSNQIWVYDKKYEVGQRCYECPIGYYASTTGSTYCKPCPDGYYCPDKKGPPLACPKGTYSNSNNTRLNWNQWPNMYIDTCLSCPPNTYANKTGSTECLPCPDGKSCYNPAYSPVDLPAGLYVRTYQNWEYNPYYNNWSPYTATEVVSCQQGQYLVNPANPWIENNNNSESTSTPTSTTSFPWYTSSSYQMSPFCEGCPRGYYCPNAATSPQRCPAGFVPNQEWSAWSCQACPIGRYSDDSGNCLACPAGSYCPDPTMKPILCPRGTYSWYNQTRCWTCWMGSYTSGEGSQACTSCPAGCCCSDPTQDPVCAIPWTSTSYPNSGSTNNWPNWSNTNPPTWSDTYPPWSTPGWSDTYPPWSTPGWNNSYPSSSSQYPYWSTSFPPPWSSQNPNNGSSPMPTGSSPAPTSAPLGR